MLIEGIHYPRGISLPQARKLARDGASDSLPTETDRAVDLHPDHRQREDAKREKSDEDLLDENLGDLETSAKEVPAASTRGQIDILA